MSRRQGKRRRTRSVELQILREFAQTDQNEQGHAVLQEQLENEPRGIREIFAKLEKGGSK